MIRSWITVGAYVAEIVRSGIMSIDQGQTEAGRSLGLNFTQTMRLIIIPQAFKNVLPALTNICGNSIQNLIGSKRFFQILYLDQNFTLINAHWFSVSSPVYS